MDIMAHSTLHKVTSRGQGALSTIAADGGKEDSKELRRFPTITGKGEIQEVTQAIASQGFPRCHTLLESLWLLLVHTSYPFVLISVTYYRESG